VKAIAKEYFENKFQKDIYGHVEKVTKASNNLTMTRILVYKRIALCITKIFPSKIKNINSNIKAFSVSNEN